MTAFIPRRRTCLIVLCLIAASTVVYAPLWNAQFLSVDDHAYVSDNTVVQQGLTWAGLKWAFKGAHVANYHPLTWLSHMLDCQLLGTDPRWHHGVNVVFHAINVVLLFLVLRLMTAREGASAVVAGIFAIHPLHVESVAWIAERKDVLSGMFWIITIGAYALYARSRSARWYTAALIAFALGLLSKPMVVTLPCVLLLFDIWPLGRTRWVKRAGDDPRPSSRFLLLEKIPFFVLSIASSIATLIAQSSGGAVASIDQAPLQFRIGNALVSYMRYTRKFFFPHDLAAFYPLLRPWPLVCAFAAALALAFVTFATLRLARKRPYLAVGWLYFLGTLVPVIGIIQVGNQAMADRYMYLPLIGLAIMVTWGAAELLSRRSVLIAASAAAILLAGVTFNDAGYWRDSESLFTRAIARTEPNVFALHTLAAEQLVRGKNAEAVANLERCVQLQPRNPHVRRACGYALSRTNRLDEAIKHLRIAIQLDPSDGKNWNTIGHVYRDRQKWRAAADHFSVAVELNPEDYDSRINLAVAHRELGQRDAAIEDLRAALRLNARAAEPWYLYGMLLLEMNQPAPAVEPLARAVAIDPNAADAYFRLGVALMRSGQGERAIAPLTTAVKLSPQSPEPLAHLAWLLATHPDERLRSGSDAFFLADRASRLTNAASPQTLDSMAAALAEQRQFEQAAQIASQAAELARQAGDTALSAKLESHARRFRDRQPLRDTTLAGGDAGEALSQ